MTINDYFQRVYLLNLKRRKDRHALAIQELAASGIDSSRVILWEAYDDPESGNRGCSRSHRELLREVADGPHDRVLILEDDFKVLTRDDLIQGGFTYKPCPVMETFCSVLDGKGNLAERFEYLISFLPPSFDVLYLAAGYAEPPISRLNKHVLRVGRMLTTSTYAITREFARIWTRHIDAQYGTDYQQFSGIDNMIGELSHANQYYCLQPRLAFQRMSKSDLNGQENSYLMSMTDPYHENLL